MNKINPADEICLRILEHINEDPYITQRNLASKLGIALGLTNIYIKRLCKKGYIKIKNLTGKKICYILTPKGFAEKANLTFKYMAKSFNYLKELREKIDRAYRLMISSNVKEVIIWGNEELSELCYIASKGLPIKIIGVVSFNDNKNFHEYQVYSKEEIKHINFDAILVATFHEEEIAELKQIDKQRIYYIWQIQ